MECEEVLLCECQLRPKVFRFYTGIDVEDFHYLKSVLGDSVSDMTYFRSHVEADHDGHIPFHGPARKRSQDAELFLTLCKQRHDCPDADLASRSLISQSSIFEFFEHGHFVSCVCSSRLTYGLQRSLSAVVCQKFSWRST